MGFTTKTERFAPEIAAYRLFTPEIGQWMREQAKPRFTVAVVQASHLLDFSKE
jgi:hypothetical protein